jgi:hypothetical protein
LGHSVLSFGREFYLLLWVVGALGNGCFGGFYFVLWAIGPYRSWIMVIRALSCSNRHSIIGEKKPINEDITI